MTKFYNIDALVLAGGKSSRMNFSDKALLKIGNKTFLENLEILFSNFNRKYISLNSSQNISSNSFIRIDDEYNEIGPISGLYNGLSKCESSYLFVAPCDVPNLTADFLEYITNFISSDYDAFIVKDKDGFIHPLMGVYNKSALEKIKIAINSEDYKIMNLVKNLNVKYIDLKYTNFDDLEILKNINTPEDYKNLTSSSENKTKFFAVSGIKNSGKTTLITKLLKKFKDEGYKVGTIKHDGHDFQMDNLDSDTDKHIKSGAHGTLIFSKNKFMFLEQTPETEIEFYLNFFKDYDIIILEGFKGSNHPKLEIIRKNISNKSVCNLNNLKFIVSDLEVISNVNDIKILDINDIGSIFKEIKTVIF
ncbi:molybdopterin-guanine dinucleotide biosynthesis protein B [Cetobacterium sp.]|uniref:molybdopterin-guanine dinucleotide biosynthesis protein B n=1 Tax=Cetobacterium sp. TaxID=2071632 RepID=UPI003F3345A0